MVPPGRSAFAGFRRQRARVSPGSTDNADDDFFLFLHYWDTHIPYVPEEPFRSRYTWESGRWVDPRRDGPPREPRPSYPLFKRNLYDYLDRIPNLDYIADLHYAEVAYLDHELGRLFGHLADLGILDECMIVIFGDHGEIMTEHDASFDHAGLYDSVVHVPLIIRAPEVAPCRPSTASSRSSTSCRPCSSSAEWATIPRSPGATVVPSCPSSTVKSTSTAT